MMDMNEPNVINVIDFNAAVHQVIVYKYIYNWIPWVENVVTFHDITSEGLIRE